MVTPIVDKVIEQMASMPYEMQWRVLEFTRALALALSSPTGTAGGQILRFAGAIAPDDLELMREAIEKGCERVNGDECNRNDFTFPRTDAILGA